MFDKIIALCVFFVVAASAADECGVCMSNFVSCVNNTSYMLCTDETETAVTLSPIDDEIYNCNSGEFCTNSLNVCEENPDGSTIIAVCDQSSGSCGTCAGKNNGDFICLSATQFAICRANGVASNPLACPTGQLCSEDIAKAGLKKVCAPQVVLDYLEAKQTCDIAGTVTPPTTTISPASSTTPLSDSALSAACANSNQSGAYFQIPHPTAGECRKYIYCQREGNGYLALEMNCKSGQFYSTAQKRCIQAAQCPNASS